VVVDTCLPQSFSATGVSNLMTGELSVVITGGSGVRIWWECTTTCMYRHCLSHKVEAMLRSVVMVTDWDDTILGCDLT